MPVGADGFRLPSVSQSSNKNKIESLGGEQDDFCKTFVIHGENHTLANALKHVIIQYPEVTFCGYTIPHPLENKVHLRIQSTKKSAVEILMQGLKDLKAQNMQVLKMLRKEMRTHKKPIKEEEESS